MLDKLDFNSTADDANPTNLGALYGLALGDAWGYVTEFKNHARILPQHLVVPELTVISDDTQMSLYNLYAMEKVKPYLSEECRSETIAYDHEVQDAVRMMFADEHLKFYHDEDNNRAPGNTCMSALMTYEEARTAGTSTTALEGSLENHSKGCGTIMRAPWLGLLTNWDRGTLTLISIIQSQTTHGHPASWVASAVATLLMLDIANKVDFVKEYKDVVELEGKPGAELVYHAFTILEELKGLQSNLADEAFMEAVDEVLDEFKERFYDDWGTFVDSEESDDVTEWFGAGWTADQALFSSVAVASLYRLKPYAGIKRLVWTGGDSDSIAAIGGAFMMGYAGASALGGAEYVGNLVKVMNSRLEMRYRAELDDAVRIVQEVNSL